MFKVDNINFRSVEGLRDGYHLGEESVPSRDVIRIPSVRANQLEGGTESKIISQSTDIGDRISSDNTLPQHDR